MGAMSVGHWLVVLLVIALFFGPRRLASLGKSLGEGVAGLRDGLVGRDDAPEENASSTERTSRG